ncbi:MAG: glycosyltransferase family 2 protein [Patescibacteria group bacterium]
MSNWKYKRFFEILPGAIAWVVIISPLFLAYYAPRFLAIVLLFYVTFWLVRTFFMSYRLILGYKNYRKDTKIDWFAKLKQLPPDKSYKDIWHLVIVPTYKEDIAILEHSIQSVYQSNYPMDKVVYVLAIEERAKEQAEPYGKILTEKYKDKVADYLVIMHPKDMPNEIIGKGPNITYSGKIMLEYFKKKNIPLDNVIVTNMDADHRMDKNYLPCLTYLYLTDPDPIHKSFQPLPMFFNNIWDVPMPMRLIAMGSSFWQLIVATRPSRLRNFSAQAQSMAALEMTDFWSKQSVVEDGHQFWRSYYRFNGDHDVVPLYTPIYQDAILAGDMKSTIKEQYLQKRRWSWGVSDIPYVMEHTIKDKKIHWIDRWSNALILWESHVSWSTASIILATASWYPLVLNGSFKETVMAFYFPFIYRRILYIAWIGMIVTLTISTLLVPPYRGKKPIRRIFLDWILTPIVMPITSIAFSAIPALESQTRLMLGKYLEFRVTIKSTKRTSIESELAQ